MGFHLNGGNYTSVPKSGLFDSAFVESPIDNTVSRFAHGRPPSRALGTAFYEAPCPSRGVETIATATLVVKNARIYTADPTNPWAEAVAVNGDRIAGVGSVSDVEKLEGPRTRVIDAKARLVLPGFIDSHVHLIWGYEVGSWIDLTDRPSLSEVLRRVAHYATSHENEEIVVGYGFDYDALSSKGLPTKEDLDAAVSDRPVLLMAYDGHTGLGNTTFTERVRSLANIEGSDLGDKQWDSRSRKPSGVFLRVFDLLPVLPEIRRRRSLDGLKRVVAEATRLGITSAFDVQVNLEDLHAYDDLRRAGDLTVRITAAIYRPKGTPIARHAEFAAARARYQDDWYRIRAVKLYIDGVVETGSAALLEPYANNPGSRGTLEYTVEEFRSIVADLAGIGFQICTHACGDLGARTALDAYGSLPKANSSVALRHRVEHCEVLSPLDIPRFARLGVIPCMMPEHAAQEFTVRWREALGAPRSSTAFPWRTLLEAQASVCFASDWPVASLDPLRGIHRAVALTTSDGRPSSQRIAMKDAVDGYTLRAAFACHGEVTRGSLVAGKYADLVILSHDLFKTSEDRVPEARVLTTVVGGNIVYGEGRAVAPSK